MNNKFDTGQNTLPVAFDEAAEFERINRLLCRSQKFKNPQIRFKIENKKNPFLIWRKHFNKSVEEIVSLMQRRMEIPVERYKLLEEGEGEEDADAEDILAFCAALHLHPFDLMDGVGIVSDAILHALLIVYDSPEFLSSKLYKPKDLAHTVLIDETLNSYEELHTQKELFERRYRKEQSLTIDFIDKLLRLDGKMSVDPLGVFDQAHEFWQVSQDELNAMNIRFNHVSSQWTKNSEQYHLFGLYLYHDDRSWVSKKLFKDMGSRDPYEVMADYLNKPEYLGLRSFPELTAPIFLNGRAYSWKEAQREHAKYAEIVFLAAREMISIKPKKEMVPLQNNLFNTWINENHETLARYENRQIILQHPDFAPLKRDYHTGQNRTKSHEFRNQP